MVSSLPRWIWDVLVAADVDGTLLWTMEPLSLLLGKRGKPTFLAAGFLIALSSVVNKLSYTLEEQETF